MDREGLALVLVMIMAGLVLVRVQKATIIINGIGLFYNGAAQIIHKTMSNWSIGPDGVAQIYPTAPGETEFYLNTDNPYKGGAYTGSAAQYYTYRNIQVQSKNRIIARNQLDDTEAEWMK